MAIPWIPLLSIGASLAGSFFGNQDKGQTSSNTNSTGTGTTAQTQQLNSESSQTTNQNTTQNSTDNATSTSGESINRLDAQTLEQLTGAVRGLIGSTGSNAEALTQELARITGSTNNFNADQFVSDIMSSASATAASDLESSTGQLRSRIGATSGSNSAAALLEQKLKTQSNAALAGVKANAVQTAEGIKQAGETNRVNAVTALTGSSNDQLNQLLNQLVQSTQTSTGTSATTNTGTTTGTTTGTATETNKQQQNSAGATTSTESSNTNGSSFNQNNDWTKILSGIGNALSATF